MSQHTDAIRGMLDVGVQRGIFKNSEAVIKLHDAVNYVTALEGDFKQISFLNAELSKELQEVKLKLLNLQMPGMEGK